MKDDIPCEKINGEHSYWNPAENKCTVEKSALCELRETGDTGTPQPGE